MELDEIGMKKRTPRVAVVMGSKSDWETMRSCVAMLNELGIPNERRVVSAHRTPGLMASFAKRAEARGIRVIIAGAGGAAHLPGMLAAQTSLPVLGVPVESKTLKGLDSLLSIAQMPGGIPVGTLAIGAAGAKNAALLAASVLALHDPKVRIALKAFRKKQTADALASILP
jgi:5-(carboxyamino)imidazole ribonucleotide mutase